MPGRPLRIAVLADFDGPHARRWLEVFVARGHDVHAISFYAPRAELPGVTLHVLSGGETRTLRGPQDERLVGRERVLDRPRPEGRGLPWLSEVLRWVGRRLPASMMRFVQAWRYRRAGLRRVVREIAPDVLHAHYVVEHGFYGALAGFHPYVVSAWGSDLLVESHKTLGGIAARYALRRADLVTANDPSLAGREVELGVVASKVEVVRLGIDEVFWETSPPNPFSVNGEGGPEAEEGDARSLTIISDRALEPLYNVDVVLRAFALVRRDVAEVRLVVAHEGNEGPRLRELASRLGVDEAVRFVGRLAARDLAVALRGTQVYVSVPDSDSFALSTLEAMASGCFPVVSDLPSVEGMIEDGVNGLLVRPGDVEGLAAALRRALTDVELRRGAATPNRARAEAEGRRERNMLAMEASYYRLAGIAAAASKPE